jgi:dTDP-4-amino-4,6-dideoxygalactose transaminase
VAARGISLPTHGQLTEDDVDRVVVSLRANVSASALPGHRK